MDHQTLLFFLASVVIGGLVVMGAEKNIRRPPHLPPGQGWGYHDHLPYDPPHRYYPGGQDPSGWREYYRIKSCLTIVVVLALLAVGLILWFRYGQGL